VTEIKEKMEENEVALARLALSGHGHATQGALVGSMGHSGVDQMKARATAAQNTASAGLSPICSGAHKATKTEIIGRRSRDRGQAWPELLWHVLVEIAQHPNTKLWSRSARE
jgi:hypothetical protein